MMRVCVGIGREKRSSLACFDCRRYVARTREPICAYFDARFRRPTYGRPIVAAVVSTPNLARQKLRAWLCTGITMLYLLCRGFVTTELVSL